MNACGEVWASIDGEVGSLWSIDGGKFGASMSEALVGGKGRMHW